MASPTVSTAACSREHLTVLVVLAGLACLPACSGPVTPADADAGAPRMDADATAPRPDSAADARALDAPDGAPGSDATADAPAPIDAADVTADVTADAALDAPPDAAEDDASGPPPDAPPDAAADAASDGPGTARAAQLALTRGEVDSAVHRTSSCALVTDGTVRCWGSNYRGQLGDGSGVTQPTPVTVAGLTNVVELAAGFRHYCARLADGTVRCWGANDGGQLGDGTSVDRTTPVAVVGLRNVAGLAAGDAHTCARLTDGTARCWGANEAGEIGAPTSDSCRYLGIFPYSCTFTPVDPGLVDTLEIAAGAAHTCARKADGTVRCWGYAQDGEYGLLVSSFCMLGTSMFRCATVPTPVAALLGAAELSLGESYTCARMSGGTVVCAGRNEFAQLGDGTTSTRFSFAPVSGVTDAVDLASGEQHNCARLRDGSVRCWGDNQGGQIPAATHDACVDVLGRSTSCNRTAVDVPAFAGFVELAAGPSDTCGRDASGAVFCVGSNGYGQLGDGTFENRATPVAVVGLP